MALDFPFNVSDDSKTSLGPVIPSDVNSIERWIAELFDSDHLSKLLRDCLNLSTAYSFWQGLYRKRVKKKTHVTTSSRLKVQKITNSKPSQLLHALTWRLALYHFYLLPRHSSRDVGVLVFRMPTGERGQRSTPYAEPKEQQDRSSVYTQSTSKQK